MMEVNINAAALKPPIADRMEITGRIAGIMNMTDEDARKQLPQIALVLEEYNRCRVAGDDPPTALKKTLTVLRELRGGCSYVPHRGA